MHNAAIDKVLLAADERLQSARFGLVDMSNPHRAQSGFYNAVVFGRAVTFALQNLRGKVDDFDRWYEPKQLEMKSDALMLYFNDLRSKIEKQVDRHTATSTYINSFTPDDMNRLGPPPPNATSFFIGDQSGGSGCNIERDDGTIEKYYIDFPPEIGTVTVYLMGVPENYRELPAKELVATYLRHMENLIQDARRQFGS